MADTKIEWADKVWNPVTGCTPISEGCEHCYAERMAKRLAGRFGYPEDEPFRVTYHEDKLTEPSSWKSPKRVFVCSMADLFHEDVSFDYLYRVFSVMGECPQHTFMILTKRPERMKAFFDGHQILDYIPYVWLGVTCENQARADERIPILLQIPAAVRFVSLEPMLGPVDLGAYLPGCWECAGTCGFRTAEDPTLMRCYECGHEQTDEWGTDEHGQDKCPECWAISTIEYPCPRCDDYPMVQHHPETPCLSWVIPGGETGPGARSCKPPGRSEGA